MIRINVLTGGAVSPNSEAFLFPLIVHRRALRRAGYSVRIYDAVTPRVTECDLLFVERTFFGHQHRWPGSWEGVIDELERLRRGPEALCWFDTTASSGTLQTPVFPHVDLYCKPQILRDRTRYTRRYYGSRLYTDYYHRTFGIEDQAATWSEPLGAKDLQKFHLSWNSGLANYGRWRSELGWLHRRSRLRWFVRPPGRWARPKSERRMPVSARFGIAHERATIRYQRQAMADLLGNRVAAERVSRRAYHRELADAQVVLSPFGWGEKCYRDYETFLHGAVLVKPDMSHMETWPDLYGPESISTHDWRLGNLQEVLDRLRDHPRERVELAARGQENYRRHVAGPDAARLFLDHLGRIVERVRSAA